MLQLHTILPDTLELLKKIQALPTVTGTRLVGGTALALQIGHRQSVDLDFFGDLFGDIEQCEEDLRTIGKLSIIKSTDNIRLNTINGIKVDFVNYSIYPWIDERVSLTTRKST